MPEEINGFSRVEYLSIFITLLYALAAAEFLLGWGKLLRNRNEITIGIEHLLWSAVLFMTLLLNWYAMWPRLAHLEKGFIDFVIVFFPILIFYFLSIWLFPDMDKEHDLKDYFENNSRKILLLLVAYFLLQNIITIFLDKESVFSLFIIARSVLIIFGIIAIFSGSKLWRRILLGVSYVLLIFAIFQLS